MANPETNRNVVQICDDLTENYHGYIRKMGPKLLWRNRNIQTIHHPDFQNLKRLLTDMIQALTPHLLKEEITLFPYCKKLIQATERFSLPRHPLTPTIDALATEHLEWQSQLEEIEAMTYHLKPAMQEDSYFQAWNQELDQFIAVFKQLIHIENEILFPQIRNLEKQVFGL